MLKNCIAEYAPVATEQVTLQPNEVLHHSFRANLAKKHHLGYRVESSVDFSCHLTNQRVILQPVSPAHPSQTIPLSQISSFKVVRALNFTAFAQVNCKSSYEMGNSDLVLAVQNCPSQRTNASHSNRSEDFVHLGNSLLNPEGNLSNLDSKAVELQAALAQDRLVLLDFWVPKCTPCFQLDAVLDALLGRYGDQIALVKVNVEESQAIALQYGIECFPTVLFFKSGVVVDQIVGAVPQSVTAKVLERYVQPIAVA
ncbi:MAG: thioredoxin domain-containing protein [Phormidesmis sp.]